MAIGTPDIPTLPTVPLAAVSYTHLDVYKRQDIVIAQFFIEKLQDSVLVI